jgi:type I pantothenate kinase
VDRRATLLVSDFVDFAVYVDADEADLQDWFLRRIRSLRAAADGDETSFFARFAGLSDEELTAAGRAVWAGVNRPNIVEHIAPSRPRADLVIEKGGDHSVRRVIARPR